MRISDWSSDVCSSDLAAGDQAIRWEVGDDFATILGDVHLFLDPGGAGSVISAAPRFKREHHSFAKRLVLATVALRNDRPLHECKAYSMPLLEKKRLCLVTIATFCRLRPDMIHLLSRDPQAETLNTN